MISPEVKAAVDEIHHDRDALSAASKANSLQASQIADLQAQVTALQPGHLSDEDRQALLDAVNSVDETNDMLATAVPANVDASVPAASPVAATPPPNDPDAPRPDPIAGTGLNGSVPLMPNMAFDPDPTGARGIGDAGQPNNPAAIETAGGFVVVGGGTTQRAPGSRPESPSSSQVVPLDPDAKAPASTADEVKSGLGDSSQNALLGNDGQPIADGPGMPREPAPAADEAAQKRADLVEQERQARADNPLNLAPAGTPQAGSPEAEKDAQKRREDEQRAAVDRQRSRDDAEQGKPTPGSPGPDPVSGPAPGTPL